jgi:hypothetical protein
VAGDPARHEADVEATLVPEMLAGQRLLAAFARHPGTFHTALATPPGWRIPARLAIALLSR